MYLSQFAFLTRSSRSIYIHYTFEGVRAWLCLISADDIYKVFICFAFAINIPIVAYYFLANNPLSFIAIQIEFELQYKENFSSNIWVNLLQFDVSIQHIILNMQCYKNMSPCNITNYQKEIYVNLPTNRKPHTSMET